MLKQTWFITENNSYNPFSFSLQQMRNVFRVTCIVENSIKMHRRRNHRSEYNRKTIPGASCYCYYFHRSLKNILTKKPAKTGRWRPSLQNYELKIECKLQMPKNNYQYADVCISQHTLSAVITLNCSEEGGHI